MSVTPVVQRGYPSEVHRFLTNPKGLFFPHCFAPASSFSDRAGAQFGTLTGVGRGVEQSRLTGFGNSDAR